MNYLRSLGFLVISLQLVRSSIDTGVRKKRIIHGEDLGDRQSGYLVTNYFTWISNKHYCGTFDSFGSFFTNVESLFKNYDERGYWDCDANPQNLKCGGALVTPNIVQTACHCIGKMVDEAPDKDGFRRYLADDAFTDMVLVYHGATKTDNMHKGYTSRLFFIHQRCGYRYDLLIHDYGLIALKADAASRSNPFNFAPVYSEKNPQPSLVEIQCRSPHLSGCRFRSVCEFRAKN
ncbi:hypothetical protein GE061_017925 [Apolygus lucorum]|uniref:Peptidase S1 domain-containing protein n=1 Tax=Apolygus lucorum TaxID=248454 RepID=A0A8S9XDP1_APOLU|nr:hypothetical protein GE061_017925 [Apolygus lucorum]